MEANADVIGGEEEIGRMRVIRITRMKGGDLGGLLSLIEI